MRTIRWGIIGVGNVTEVKSGPGFQKAQHSELVAVMRRDGAAAQDYAARHGVPRWYDDADALLHDPDVDAVYIATPPHVHLDYTLRAARAGKPVYVEKPMALNHDECQRMIGACQSAGVPLYVAYYRRAMPRFVRIKEIIDAGEIGDVRAVQLTVWQSVVERYTNPAGRAWRVLPAISGGGIFVDLGSHMLDYLDYVLGPIQTVRGFAANQGRHYPAEDVVTASFAFASGAYGTGLWSFTTGGNGERAELWGTRGRLAFSMFDPTPVELTVGDHTTHLELGYPEHVQQPLIQTIVDDLNGVGTCPSTGTSAARTSWVMDQLLAGYAPIDPDALIDPDVSTE